MKALRALMFVLALSACAYAGDMDNGIVGTPTPLPTPTLATTVEIENIDGDIQTGLTTTDIVIETALNTLQSALALF